MRKKLRILAAIAAPLGVAILFSMRDLWLSIAGRLKPCLFHAVTGYHCPSCGNTRCIRALLEGDILSAIRNNAVIVTVLVLLVLWYLETVIRIWREEVRLLPRSPWFWGALPILAAVYYVVRNFVPGMGPV